MKILITGGNGFIATHLSSHLSKEHNVYAPSKIELDCMNIRAVNKLFDNHKFDVVIHTALTGREELFSNDIAFRDDAITMWDNIYKQRARYRQLIHFGSAYDVMDTPYGNGKKAIAESCKRTDNFYNLRLFGNFHHTEKDTRFFKKLQTTTKFIISENKLFDYFHLEDICPVVDFVMNEKPTNRLFDLVYEEKRTLISQAMEFCVLNEVKTVIETSSEGPAFIGNSDILKSFNIPLHGLEAGFKKYYEG